MANTGRTGVGGMLRGKPLSDPGRREHVTPIYEWSCGDWNFRLAGFFDETGLSFDVYLQEKDDFGALCWLPDVCTVEAKFHALAESLREQKGIKIGE